jgi:tetratricopeptide (TPR) repeat protein
MPDALKSTVLAILASAFGWVAHRLWRRLRFRRALPWGGVVTAHEPERLEIPVSGREEELASLEKALEKKSLIVVGGWAGIGKTTLGRALAQRLDWPKLGVWVDCKAGMGLESLINALANYFGTNHEDFSRILEKDLATTPEQGIAAFVSALDRKENIVFLDDFQLVDDPVVLDDLLKALSLRPKQARTVVLTREADRVKDLLRPEGAKHAYAEELPLGDLDRKGAFELLRDRGLEECGEDELQRLYDKTNGHPKGLELCAGLVKTGMEIEEIESLPLFERSGDEEKSLRKILQETEKRLSKDELRLLQRCSVFDEPFNGRAMDYIYQTDRWKDVLPGLEERFLVSRTDGQHEVHPLSREYFYTGLKDLKLVHGLAGHYYSAQAEVSTEEQEQLTLRLKAHYHFQLAGDSHQLIEMFSHIHKPLVNAGRWVEAKRVCELTLEASRKLKDRKAESALLNSLGNMCSREGEWDRAIELYNKSLEIKEQVGDIHGMAQTYNNLGLVYANRGEWDRAIELYNKDLEISEQVGDIHGMAKTYTNLGSVYANRGEWDRAIELYNKDLEISEQVGDIHGMAKTYTNLGLVYADRGEWDRAIELYNKDLEISEQVGDIHGMAKTWGNLALLYEDREQYVPALEYIEKALEVFKQLGSFEMQKADEHAVRIKEKMKEGSKEES